MPRGPASAIRSSISSFPTPLASPAAITAPIEVATYQAGSKPASFSARQAPRCAAVLAPPPLSTSATGRTVKACRLRSRWALRPSVALPLLLGLRHQPGNPLRLALVVHCHEDHVRGVRVPPLTAADPSRSRPRP